MSADNIHFHGRIGNDPKISLNIWGFFFSCRGNFLGTQKRVRVSHGKRIVDVRVIAVLLYQAVLISPPWLQEHIHNKILLSLSDEKCN